MRLVGVIVILLRVQPQNVAVLLVDVFCDAVGLGGVTTLLILQCNLPLLWAYVGTVTEVCKAFTAALHRLEVLAFLRRLILPFQRQLSRNDVCYFLFVWVTFHHVFTCWSILIRVKRLVVIGVILAFQCII